MILKGKEEMYYLLRLFLYSSKFE